MKESTSTRSSTAWSRSKRSFTLNSITDIRNLWRFSAGTTCLESGLRHLPQGERIHRNVWEKLYHSKLPKAIIAPPSEAQKGGIMTQTERTLQYFRTHKRGLTPLDMWTKLGIYRASDVVLRLRRKGHDIKTDLVKVKNKFGEECQVAYYTLEE